VIESLQDASQEPGHESVDFIVARLDSRVRLRTIRNGIVGEHETSACVGDADAIEAVGVHESSGISSHDLLVFPTFYRFDVTIN
jgi:hypothetical protein